MRQIITDNGTNYSFFISAGVFILLLLIFSNLLPPKITVVENNSDNLVLCDCQTNSAATILFAEDEEEDNSDKELYDQCLGNYYFADSFFPHRFFSGDEKQKINLIKNYFHNDLSPPHFLKR